MLPINSTAADSRVTLIMGDMSQALLPEYPAYSDPPVVWNPTQSADGTFSSVAH
jgi:hypothetical protein